MITATDALWAFKAYGPDIFYVGEDQSSQHDEDLFFFRMPPTDKSPNQELRKLPHPKDWTIIWIKYDSESDSFKPLINLIAQLCRQILLVESQDKGMSLQGFDIIIPAYQALNKLLLQIGDEALAEKYSEVSIELKKEQSRRSSDSTNCSTPLRSIRCQKGLGYITFPEELFERENSLTQDVSKREERLPEELFERKSSLMQDGFKRKERLIDLIIKLCGRILLVEPKDKNMLLENFKVIIPAYQDFNNLLLQIDKEAFVEKCLGGSKVKDEQDRRMHKSANDSPPLRSILCQNGSGYIILPGELIEQISSPILGDSKREEQCLKPNSETFQLSEPTFARKPKRERSEINDTQTKDTGIKRHKEDAETPSLSQEELEALVKDFIKANNIFGFTSGTSPDTVPTRDISAQFCNNFSSSPDTSPGATPSRRFSAQSSSPLGFFSEENSWPLGLQSFDSRYYPQTVSGLPPHSQVPSNPASVRSKDSLHYLEGLRSAYDLPCYASNRDEQAVPRSPDRLPSLRLFFSGDSCSQ